MNNRSEPLTRGQAKNPSAIPPGVGSQSNFVIAQPIKSVGIGIVLSLLFGPIGLFYASVSGGIIMLIVGGILNLIGLLMLGFGLIVTIPLTCIICAIWAYVSIESYNEDLIRRSRGL